MPSLRQPSKVWRAFTGREWDETAIDPAALGIEQEMRAPQGEASETGRAAEAAAAGTDALAGTAGATRDALVIAAALCLWHAGITETPERGAALARRRIDSGDAAARLEAACG